MENIIRWQSSNDEHYKFAKKSVIFFAHKLNSHCTHVQMLICILRISDTETLCPFPECWKLQIFWQMPMFGHFIFEKEMNKS